MLAVAALLLALPLAILPAHAQSSAPPLPQVAAAGNGRLTFWGFSVYDAQLWVAPGFRRSAFASHLFALELAYLRSFSSADVASRTIDEMRRAAPLDATQAQRWQDEMRELLPGVKDGDRVVGVNRPGRGVEFFMNGRRLGELADVEFARRFFAIWLGPATSEPGLREALLAGTPP